MDRIRFRFWLVAMDVAHAIDSKLWRGFDPRRLTWRFYLWTIARAASADPSWRAP
ncbi:MAG TPA: hypothetical protein VFO62_10580 [Candidatus Binatia bacterium]|nr:hypothetical protein [Candidatus Binatia bacterium]